MKVKGVDVLFSRNMFFKCLKAAMLPLIAPTRPPDGSQIAPMRCREAPTRLPDGSQMAQRKPQDVSWSPPSDIGEACVFLLPRGGLAEHVPNRELCVSHKFLKLFELPFKH